MLRVLHAAGTQGRDDVMLDKPNERLSFNRLRQYPFRRLHILIRIEKQNQPCVCRESNPGHLDGNEVFYH